MGIVVLYGAVIVGFNLVWAVSYRFMRIWLMLMWCLLATATGAEAGLAILIVFAISVLPIIAHGLRYAIQQASGPVERHRIAVVDSCVEFAFGVILAGTAFRLLANGFGGSDAALVLHAGLGAVAAYLFVVAFAWAGPVRAMSLGGGVAVVVLTALSWFWYPALVQNRAAAFAGDVPFTITLAGRLAGEHERHNLTFLTLPKSEYTAHATVSFETEAGPCAARWSYGMFDFYGSRYRDVCRR